MSEDDEWNYDAGEFEDEGSDEPTGDPSVEAAAAENDEGEEGWRFSLEDLEDDEEEAGWLDLSATVEPGSPEIENVVFVLLGVGLGVVVAVQLFL